MILQRNIDIVNEEPPRELCLDKTFLFSSIKSVTYEESENFKYSCPIQFLPIS